MSQKAEEVLIGLLTDYDSVDTVLRWGFREEIMPTEELALVVRWAMDYQSGSGKAPTALVLKERFGDMLSDLKVQVDEPPEESVEWALETLTFTHSKKLSGEILKEMARDVATSHPETIYDILAKHSASLGGLVNDMAPQTTRVDLRERGESMVAEHDLRAEEGDTIRGMTFGLREVDEHYGGIAPGEVAILAAPPKHGKSIFLSYMALGEWRRDRVTALVTLENSIQMTEMRIACQALGLDYKDLERGKLSPGDRASLTEWIEDVLKVSDTPLHIIKPPIGQRTPVALVQQAKALEVDSLIVDQLSFTESVPGGRRDQSVAYDVADKMRHFKTGVDSGRNPISLLMAHQINRKGVEMAGNTGWLQMSHLADSSEVERAADLVFGLYAPEEARGRNMMQLQALAVRRAEPVSFDLHWHIHRGHIGVAHILREEDLP